MAAASAAATHRFARAEGFSRAIVVSDRLERPLRLLPARGALVNPVKHFPVVTVSHKVIWPMVPQFAEMTGVSVVTVSMFVNW